MKAMLFAAGLGTRLGNETASKPKALVEVGGKPLLHHAIEKLKRAGSDEIVINVHHFSGQVINWIHKNEFGVKISVSDESDKLLDTGGGLKKARHLLDGPDPVLLYNVDVISNLDLNSVVKEHQKSGALATLVVRNRKTKRYFKFDEKHRLVGWINKTTSEIKLARPVQLELATEMAFSGIHVIQPQLFNYMPQKDKFSIVDLYLSLAKNHLIKGFYDNSDIWMDVGKPEQLSAARKMFAP